MAKAIVAIVGRPNVGKSTFFNRIMGAREAIVHDHPGVTRDRLYREAEWSGHKFLLVDTGGLMPDATEEMSKEVAEQVKLAVQEADVVVFVVDGKQGLHGADEDVAHMLRKTKKRIILAVNKIDDPKDEANVPEFYKLGLGEPHALSAMRGSGGVGDLLDEIVNALPEYAKRNGNETEDAVADGDGDAEEVEKNEFAVAIVGKPNVGKSSLVNALSNTRRTIVTAMPGTTRDAIDTIISWDGKEVTLIDTAGIRRKSKVDYGVEAFSVVRSLRAIDRSDVAVLMLDATEPPSDQDQKIAGKIEEAGKAAVIVMNKWDLVTEKSSKIMNDLMDELYRSLPHLKFAEVVFTSALTKQRLPKILEAAERAWKESRRRISTGLLNQIVNEAQTITPPPAGSRGRRLRIYYCTQVTVSPPTFALFVNDSKLLTPTYKVYLERKIREAFGFKGTPIRLLLRPKKTDK
ncbi:MAG TPA: ribosome biogenesis GTPase Der [Candidatus Obscuribacterales bacterium]